MHVKALASLLAASMRSCNVVLLLLLLLLPVLGSLAGYALHSAGPAMWCGLLDWALAGHVYNVTEVRSHKLCWTACRQQLHCVSANFLAHGSQAGRCELNNATHSQEPNSLRAKSGWIYTYGHPKVHSTNKQILTDNWLFSTLW